MTFDMSFPSGNKAKPSTETSYYAIDMSNGFTYVGREKMDCSIRSLEEVIVMNTVSGVNQGPGMVGAHFRNRAGHYRATYGILHPEAAKNDALEHLHDFEHNPNKVAILYLGKDILK